jgi:hypothetical protein
VGLWFTARRETLGFRFDYEKGLGFRFPYHSPVRLLILGRKLIGVAGFEPATPRPERGGAASPVGQAPRSLHKMRGSKTAPLSAKLLYLVGPCSPSTPARPAAKTQAKTAELGPNAARDRQSSTTRRRGALSREAARRLRARHYLPSW